MRSDLLAFKIDRRRISVAAFSGQRLDFSDRRQLPSVFSKAESSAARYVDWLARTFQPEAVAIQQPRQGPGSLASRLAESITSQLRNTGLPILDVNSKALLEAFAHPPLRYRTQLRQVIASIWPILNSKGSGASCLDAAALGLYVQVEKMFSAQDN